MSHDSRAAAWVRSSIRRLATVCLTALVSACSQSAPLRDTSALSQTDSLGYTLQDDGSGYGLTLNVRFTNTTQRPVHFVNCDGVTGFRLEKQLPGGWVTAISPQKKLCLSPPITVMPGERFETSLWVHGSYPGKPDSDYKVDDVRGTYRVVWTEAVSNYDEQRRPFGEPLPFEQRISNRFALNLPR